jgi:hypothetical protein
MVMARALQHSPQSWLTSFAQRRFLKLAFLDFDQLVCRSGKAEPK